MFLLRFVRIIFITASILIIYTTESFSQEEDLKKHIHINHDGNKDFKCEPCGKSFSEAGDLKNHMQTVHDGYKDHKCKCK